LTEFGQYRPHGAAGDKREVNDIEEELVQLGESTAQEPVEVFDSCVGRVQARLSSLKPQIVAIASELNSKGFLKRDEILSILEITPRTPAEKIDSIR